MVTGLRIAHAARYGELARLLVAHRDMLGRDLPSRDLSRDAPAPATLESARADAESLARELEQLGPTYVKLGQLLSSRVDLLPGPYIDALSRLQDDAEPFDAIAVRRIVEEELEGRIEALFGSFDLSPMGAGSLGQVHRATLSDGRPVAIKVQRPGVRAQVLDDIEVISELAQAVDQHVGAARRAGITGMVDQFRRSLIYELDYVHELTNLRMLAAVLEPYDALFVPDPIEELSTGRVLTMSLVEGRSVSTLREGSVDEKVGGTLVDQLFKAYLDQVLVHGTFHADPHPGNLVLTGDGRLGLIDVGMTAQVSPDLQSQLLRLLVGLGEGRGQAVAAALERSGEPLEDFDRDALSRDVAALVVGVSGLEVADLKVGSQLGDLARIAVANGLRPAPELSMIAKAMLNLDDVARRLASSYDIGRAIRQHTASLMRHHLAAAASPGNLVSQALDAKEFAEHLPERMNRVLDALAEGTFHINVDGMDEADLMRSVQKLANRAAAGIAVGAFVLAAAIFSTSSAGPRWWGVSAFTVVLLGVGALVGAAIMASTLRHDLPQRRTSRHRRE